MSEPRTVYTVEIGGHGIRLDSPQAFYDTVDLLHTAALDGLPDLHLAPVTDALEVALDSIGNIEGVRT